MCAVERKGSAITAADRLKQEHIEHWNAILGNRFIAEMANDSLPLEKFIFYLRQDYLFLKEFCRFLQHGKAKYAEPRLRQFFDGAYKGTVDYEMSMQADLLSSLGTDLGDSGVNTAPATMNYISFLKRASATDLEGMLGAMTPCPWSYLEIAENLSSRGAIRTDAYHRWVQFYSSKDSAAQVHELKEILGGLYGKASVKAKQLMKKNFETACKYEYSFWEMAYKMS
jgi:thiaminase/transcriptional activator TenA